MHRFEDQLSARTRPAMTLIETLAVIVILTMVTGALGLGLAGSNRSAEARAAMARWRDLDDQARIAAQVEGAVRLQLDEDGGGVALRAIRTGEVLGAIRWSEAFKGTMMTSDNEAIVSIMVDSRGRSNDYSIILRESDDARDAQVFTTRVCGLTGWFVQEARP